MAAQREHQVDGIKQARQGLGQVGSLVGLQGVFQGLLWTAHTHTTPSLNVYIPPDLSFNQAGCLLVVLFVVGKEVLTVHFCPTEVDRGV